MPRFADITVNWNPKTKKIEVVPDIAQVYYNHPNVPSCVRWIVQSMPRKATQIEIKWNTRSPFLHMGAQVCTKKFCLVATGNLGQAGLFKYSIVFLDANANIVAIVDPWVKDDPKPPVTPN